jgi:hypothetical protein
MKMTIANRRLVVRQAVARMTKTTTERRHHHQRVPRTHATTVDQTPAEKLQDLHRVVMIGDVLTIVDELMIANEAKMNLAVEAGKNHLIERNKARDVGHPRTPLLRVAATVTIAVGSPSAVVPTRPIASHAN